MDAHQLAKFSRGIADLGAIVIAFDKVLKDAIDMLNPGLI